MAIVGLWLLVISGCLVNLGPAWRNLGGIGIPLSLYLVYLSFQLAAESRAYLRELQTATPDPSSRTRSARADLFPSPSHFGTEMRAVEATALQETSSLA